ncbi:IMPACT family protein [Brockia lithotrophica]|uniref:Putative YigZ family protein n=1 Tax=Brockia lithotrophica TaxID=933949 RepID=A0A660KWN1_9BACL|nr:YigZ family protein [Brockia lithotrophica]RKQ84711.1 putative YigZ family protein [Brockia lithotrophica]
MERSSEGVPGPDYGLSEECGTEASMVPSAEGSFWLPEAGVRTLRGPAQVEYFVERSRFLGYARRACTEDEVQNFLAELRRRHWDATHIPYAYVLGGRVPAKKADDDGEPQGTSGRPMLELLEQLGLVCAAVAVPRYFGGKKLGAGGLVRAYRHAAQLALEAAGYVRLVPCRRLVLTVDYGRYGAVESLLRETACSFAADFTVRVQLTVDVPEADVPHTLASLRELFGGGEGIRVCPEPVVGEIPEGK